MVKFSEKKQKINEMKGRQQKGDKTEFNQQKKRENVQK